MLRRSKRVRAKAGLSSDGIGIDDLPSELKLRIAGHLDIYSLAHLQQTSSQWHELIRLNDEQSWAYHAKDRRDRTLDQYVCGKRLSCFDASILWTDVTSWKDAVRRQEALARNWSFSTPKVKTTILGHDRLPDGHPPIPVIRSPITGEAIPVTSTSPTSKGVRRAFLDPAPDAQFVIFTTQDHSGVRVVDTRAGSEGQLLWQLEGRGPERPTGQFQYRNGIACWQNGRSVEVWKGRIPTPSASEPGQDPKRGHFIRVGRIGPIRGIRDFVLNETLHLSIVTYNGRLCTYNVASDDLVKISDFSVRSDGVCLFDFGTPSGGSGPQGNDLEYTICSRGIYGFSIYRKASGGRLGELFFRNGKLANASKRGVKINRLCPCYDSNFSTTNDDTDIRRAQIQHDNQEGFQVRFLRLPEYPGGDYEDIDEDIWAKIVVRQLDDGAMLLVACSTRGRVLICSDLLGLLQSMTTRLQRIVEAKVRQCLAIIDCSLASRLPEHCWLTVHGGRAAWSFDDVIYLLELPTHRNTLPGPSSRLHVMNAYYRGPITMKQWTHETLEWQGALDLHDDCLVQSCYVHPALVHDDSQGRTLENHWYPTWLEGVRIIRFGAKALDTPKTDDIQSSNRAAERTNSLKETGGSASEKETNRFESWREAERWTRDRRPEVLDSDSSSG